MPPTLPLALPALVGTALSLAVALRAVRRRPAPGSVPLALLGVAAAWWCALDVAVIVAEDPAWWFRLSQVQYLGITLAPVFWFLVARAYVREGVLRTRVPVWAFFVVPAMTLGLVATGGSGHGLVWARVEMSGAGPGISLTYGPWFWVHALYGYSLATLGVGILAARFWASPHYRPQFWALVSGSAVFFGANLSHVTGRFPYPFDPSPPAFAAFFLALGWAVRRRRVLDLVPVARGMMVERLRDGVLVADPEGKILDQNAAARRLLSPWRSELLGADLGELVPPAWLTLGEEPLERSVGKERILEFRLSRLTAPDGRVEGYALLLRDVTEERAARQELERARDDLNAMNQELERLASTDVLTGLANRRHFIRELEREWARADRGGRPPAVLLLDLDRFKVVNDTRGHLVGDEVLASVGRVLAEEVRPQDVASRFGGEEFAILFTDTPSMAAHAASERILAALRALPHRDEAGVVFTVTASGGLADRHPSDATPSDLLMRADRALYAAKDAGRDRLEVAPPN